MRRRTAAENNAKPPAKPRQETTLEAYERRIKKKAAKTMHTIKGSIPSKGQMQQHTKQTFREIRVRKINYALGKHFNSSNI